MSDFYFAYGSNMSPERMRAREVRVVSRQPARLPGYALCFNKRASDRPRCAYANLSVQRDAVAEGVLYRLASPTEIGKLDAYEGTPRLYSRDIWPVETDDGPVAAWVYMANRAVITEGLRPEAAYLAHLLAGADCLSEAYLARLRAQATA